MAAAVAPPAAMNAREFKALAQTDAAGGTAEEFARTADFDADPAKTGILAARWPTPLTAPAALRSASDRTPSFDGA